MRSILITGGLSKVGIEIIEYLLNNTDYIVINVDIYDNFINNNKNEEFKTYKNYVYIRTNIVNIDSLEFLMYTYNVVTVVHLSYFYLLKEIPRLYYENVFTTSILLDLCVKYNIENFYTLTEDVICNEQNLKDPIVFIKSQLCLLFSYFRFNHKINIVLLKSVDEIKKLSN